MIQDQYGRSIHYLRISLTDQCNLRCVYCMPEDMSFRPSSALLQDRELIRLARIFAELGFDKFRLTGGEPTIRHNVTELVQQLAALPGVREIAMTTNGILLKHLAQPLADAGLHRLNISIDSLNPKTFRRLTRWGNVDDVLAGINAAEAAGFPIKLNTVVVRDVNDKEDIVQLARLTLDHPWQVRFIEMMPLGRISDFQLSHIVTEDELRANIEAALGPLTLQNEGQLDGEARIFKLKGAKGALGFISSVTKPFCAACNRARLTADGKLRLCLLRDKEMDLMSLLRGGATDEELKAHIEKSIWYKPWGHGLAERAYPTHRVMSEIGG
ncbi:MAG: GTP 3',8-cyclase MoaA [Kiritimatiellae bacterium]|nr:GTP 3',8-cyclase MoaA [Kiritimatiellia bacterium]MCO5062191.1 GTP 3',8-cyclase MoaA [Kiritimatiellia bacterium]MCO5068997.1 GTP 3',8-cyclase MoaA [Kiritimatiellia bacterium]MCO6401672.1 GTP 3',8-cyclase MoaA [Verrucomicrobiota bacterium]